MVRKITFINVSCYQQLIISTATALYFESFFSHVKQFSWEPTAQNQPSADKRQFMRKRRAYSIHLVVYSCAVYQSIGDRRTLVGKFPCWRRRRSSDRRRPAARELPPAPPAHHTRSLATHDRLFTRLTYLRSS